MLTKHRAKIAHIAETPTMEARLGRQINGDAAVPYSTLVFLLNLYTDVSAEWLLLGTGEMLKKNQQQTVNKVERSLAGRDINVGTPIADDGMRLLIEEKDKRIAELEKINALLQNIVTSMTASAPKK